MPFKYDDRHFEVKITGFLHPFLLTIFLIVPGEIKTQEPIAQQMDFNVSLLSNRQIEFPANVSDQYQRYSDIWGYTAENGTEYAVLGTGTGTAIYELSDPESPTLSVFIPGTLSRWRDYKSFGHYVFGVADEGTDGLLIVDMSQAPDNITWSYWRPTLTVGTDPEKTLDKCHNLYIDSTFIFLAGCNLWGGGVLIFDLSIDPEMPSFITGGDRRYTHDVFALHDRMYTSDLSQGFAIVDISDITQPITLVTRETSSDFTHNAWTSDDGSLLFTTDERTHATIDAYDIRDPDEIILLDRYRPTATLRNPVIPHNVHYHQGYLVISYYIDGLKIVDAHDPGNLVEVGSYDTYRFRDDGFHGAWGAFPFLSSGLILVSDIETGLYVFRPEYQRAAYLQGQVSDRITGAPLSGVRIEIDSERPGLTFSAQDGSFKTGWAGDGTVIVRYEKQGYAPGIAEVELTASQYANLDLQLEPLSRYTVTGKVLDATNGQPLENAQIIIFNDHYEEQAVTNSEGVFTLATFEGQQTIAAGKWGYLHDFQISDIQGDRSEVTLTLTRGYRDDFVFDYGWQASRSANTPASQAWEKGNPRYAIYNEELTSPNGDLKDDLGKECFATGLAGSLASNLSDTSILISPFFDLTIFQDPYINYVTWFYNAGVFPADDQLQIFLGDGNEEVLIEQITHSMSGWRERSVIRVLDFMTPSNQMYLKIIAADTGEIHIYEAAIDAFSITEGQTTSSFENDVISKITIYPNPVQDWLTVELNDVVVDELKIANIMGQPLLSQGLTNRSRIHISDTPPGTYLISFFYQGKLLGSKKIIKIP
jgi:choice-of-anchor B domain-containing protein